MLDIQKREGELVRSAACGFFILKFKHGSPANEVGQRICIDNLSTWKKLEEKEFDHGVR